MADSDPTLTNPIDHVLNSTWPDEVRNLKDLLRSRLIMSDTEPTARTDSATFTAGDLGSIWIDSNSTIDNAMYILTAIGVTPTWTPTWTLASTNVIATMVAAAHTWAASQTLGAGADLIGSATSDITFNTSKFTVAGATGNTSVGGTFESVGIATLADASVTKTTAAPGADAQVSNKKYVDDSTTNPGLAGGWVNFLGRTTNGACTIQDSFNVTSVTRTAEGRHTITWDTNFSGTDYVVVGNTRGDVGGNPVVVIPIAQAATDATIATLDATSGADDDIDGRAIYVVAFGQ